MIPRDWALRILEIDDLAPAERVEIDRFLASNEEARRLVERVRAVESQAGPRGEIPQLEFHRLDWESPRDRAQADQSLRLLLDRVAAARGVTAASRPAPREGGSFFDRVMRIFPAPILVPAAVGALALLFWRLGPTGDVPAPPAPQAESPAAPAPEPAAPGPPGSLGVPGGPFGIRSFTIGSKSGLRGGALEGVWRTGDAFVLRTELQRGGNLFLVHVDPRGEVELLYPANDAEARRIFPAGASIEFPSKDSTQEWVFEGDPGPESFLLAVAPPGVVDARTVEIVSARARKPGASRDAVVAGVVKALETHVGSVRSLAIDHRAPESAER